jgi:hypothetical protein
MNTTNIVFASCQQTYRFLNELNKLSQSNKENICISSLPPFNKTDLERKTTNFSFKDYNIPVYGVKIPKIIKEIFDNKEIQENSQILFGNKINLEYVIDEYVQKKTNKIHSLIKIIQESIPIKYSLIQGSIKTILNDIDSCMCSFNYNEILTEFLQTNKKQIEKNLQTVSEIKQKFDETKTISEEELKSFNIYFEKNNQSIPLLQKFAEDFSSCKSSDFKTFEDWNNFINFHVIEKYRDTWMNNCNFDFVLSLFDIDEESSKLINEIKLNDSTVKHEYTRWLAKMLCGFNIKGCLTDAINLIFSITNQDDTKTYTEDEIVNILKDFNQDFHFYRINYSNLSLPNIMFIDMEKDDLLSVVLVYSLLKRFTDLEKVPLQLYCQLPCFEFSNDNENETCMNILNCIKKLNNYFQKAIDFTDLNSLNKNVLFSLWKNE